MSNARYLMTMLLTCGWATSATAQPAEPPHVELGASGGGVVTWFLGGHGLPGGDVRITVPTSRRRAFEGFVGLTPTISNATTGFYGLLLKQRIGDETNPDVEQFFSCGLVGGFTHYRVTDYRNPSVSHSTTAITPPIIGLIGGGVQRRVAPRLSVRFESQLVMALILPVGVRAAAGVSVPLGKLSSR